jgi:hypothetical protein
MRRTLAVVCLLLALAAIAACASNAPVPANYYENDIHHGYPGPGVTSPSAE